MELNLADPIAVMLAATRAFAAAGLEASAYGGLVVAVYGRPRETTDADLAVASVTAETAFAALAAVGLSVVRGFTDVQFGGCVVSRLTLLGGGELNTVDLVRPRSARFATAVQMRSVVGALRGEPLRLVSAEDYVLLKALATRDRDVEDAKSVVDKRRAQLDLTLMRDEAAQLASEITDHDVVGRFRAIVDG